MNKLIQALCDHDGEHLATKTITYNTESISSTAVDNQIICTKCGKVIVDKHQFDWIKEIFYDQKN